MLVDKCGFLLPMGKTRCPWGFLGRLSPEFSPLGPVVFGCRLGSNLIGDPQGLNLNPSGFPQKSFA